MSYKPYETHVTIDPLTDPADSVLFDQVSKRHGFRVADLLKRNGAKSDKDEFCTAHDYTEAEARARVRAVVTELKDKGFKLRRWKIELIVADSRRGDFL